MKKLFLFSLFICFIKLSAYEYLIYDNNRATSNQTRSYYYVDEYGVMKEKRYYLDGHYVYGNVTTQYYALYNVRINDSAFVRNEVFKEYYTNDLIFLNDLFTSPIKNAFFNYLYNENSFNNVNYIEYEDYELLYNIDGLAVECCIDGVYAGLYDMVDIRYSGNLYNSQGDLVLVNGIEPSFFQKLQDKVFGNLTGKLTQSSLLVDLLWFVTSVLVFSMLFWVVSHAIEGFKYYMKIRNNN